MLPTSASIALRRQGAGVASVPSADAPTRTGQNIATEMRYHRFKIDQTVVPSTSSLPAGRYTILRLLPPVHDEPHYRVISKDDGCERAVLEGEIRLPDLHAERLGRQH
jgi:hypothetical protein